MSLQNDIFLRAARGETTERPPVWVMRQAGRILPQYRAIRERLSGFQELVTTPDLACEVTIQPVDELGVDAAILFSDILVIPEALGLPYEMEEKRGPRFPRIITNEADINALNDAATAAAQLDYVYQAVKITKRELHNRVPLIGFAGAPWTIFAYMTEGSGSKTFSKAKAMLYAQPELSHLLLQKITDATIVYLQQKIAAGVDTVQLFDSWAGLLSPDSYRTFAVPYLRQIADALPADTPKIVFPKGAWFATPDFAESGFDVIGLDWTIAPQLARTQAGNKVLQGNMDPCMLYADTKTIERETQKMLRAFGTKHIANLGHGVYPDTPLDGVKAFINTIKEFRY
jgi:uroporphyrinogen decarboxylase